MDRLRQSFVSSSRLWQHMSFVVRHGAMWLRRDEALIFHGCTPVDDAGAFLSLAVEGRECAGRALFDALDSVVRRAFRKGAQGGGGDVDWLWYLWTGPVSPLFGKDRMATFEGYFVADKEARKEHKNPYFKSIADAITAGADIVPSVTTVRAYERPRLVADTEEGEALGQRVNALERLVRAYEEGVLLEK